MTRIEMQDIILEKMQDTLQDTIDIRKRISVAFTRWFQGLINPQEVEVEAEAEAEEM